MKATVYLLIFMTVVSVAQAEGVAAHHEPSISDLLYPAINFLILLAFLVWKLKIPMKEFFNKKAEDIQSLMNSAAEKNQDAQKRLGELQGKMKNLDAEVAKIVSEYHADVATFTKEQSAETVAIIARTKRDLESKLEGEKNEVVEKINHELLNAVIAKAQEAIKASGDMKNRVTQKIVAELR